LFIDDVAFLGIQLGRGITSGYAALEVTKLGRRFSAQLAGEVAGEPAVNA
jgi:hypothetical protein